MKKYIRLVSDLHLDFDLALAPKAVRNSMDAFWYPAALDTDSETTLVIAGDLWTQGKFLTVDFGSKQSWLARVAQQFKAVVFVLGNHDYWGTNITYEAQKVRANIASQGLENVFFLERTSVVVEGVKFLGGTLWTDYNQHDKEVLYDAPQIMNDYKKIRSTASYRKVRSEDLYKLHVETRSFIFDNSSADYEGQKVVVVTHMPPSIRSLEQHYQEKPSVMNYLYHSNLEEKISASKIDFWFHGHTHNASDYVLGNTRVMANPRGYASESNDQFNPAWLLTL